MKDILIVACGAGLQDGLSPCIFMACAVFLFLGLWFKPSFGNIAWLRIVFSLFYILSSLIFNFGPGQIFILKRNFAYGAKISYLILGVWAFVMGVICLKDWFLLNRVHSPKGFNGNGKKPLVVNGLLVGLTTIILAVIVSVLATLWPPDKYIFLLGAEEVVKTQWLTVASLLGTYLIVSLWPLWFIWVFISIKDLRPTMLKIVCAAIFFTASSCLIFIFK